MKFAIMLILLSAGLVVPASQAQEAASDTVAVQKPAPTASATSMPTESPTKTPTTTPTATPPREHAWHSGNYWGVGAQSTFPRSSFGIDYKTGYGLQGMFNYPLIPLIDLSGSVGWNHFGGEDERPGIDIWELAFGGRFAVGVFFMNAEMGYFTKVDEWNYLPGLGLRFDHWEYSLRTKVAGNSTWSTFRIGYYF